MVEFTDETSSPKVEACFCKCCSTLDCVFEAHDLEIPESPYKSKEKLYHVLNAI